MSELKPGDKVWIGVNVGIVLADDTVWYTDLRGAPIKGCFDTSYVPDVPNLAAVAKVLADHPDMAAAMDRLWRDFDPSETPLFKVDRTQLHDTRLLGKLAAALNGGTE